LKTELILLAAGQSKRFNGIKQLANINGTPMICHSLAQYKNNGHWLSGISRGYVVLGANAKKIQPVLPVDVDTLVVENWAEGMGGSLAVGLGVISDQTSHILIGLADQVAISTKDILRLLAASLEHPEKIVTASYAESFGVPAIFPRKYLTQLQALSGDKGARELLNNNQYPVIGVALKDAEIDIDTQSDLRCFKASLNEQ
jgi:molybdenum cofactor cytidylyltransferase